MAIVKKYRAKIISIKNEIAGIYTLELQSLEKPFNYSPGQFLHLAMDEDYDGSGQWPESRCFSMESNPNEETISITYAVKGWFTKCMAEKLRNGDNVWLKLPYGGLFQQPHGKENTVFIAGGTGITPFLSLFSHTSFKEYINPAIYLGFRSKDYNLYVEQLQQINNLGKRLTFVYQDKDNVLNIQKIFEENGATVSYFISGPPIMIKYFKEFLSSNGVAVGNIVTDDWE